MFWWRSLPSVLKHSITLVNPLVHHWFSFRQSTLCIRSCPVCILAYSSGSSRNSLTETFLCFSDKTLSAVAVNKGMICPNNLYNSLRSFGFGMNVGRDKRILGGSFFNSLFLELYPIVKDTSLDCLISLRASSVCVIRDCICLTSSKCFFKISTCFIFISLISVFILLITMSIFFMPFLSLFRYFC